MTSAMATTDSSGRQSAAHARQMPSLKDTAHLLTNLRQSLSYHEVVDGRELPPLLAFLSAWQSMRLERTHADLLHDPEFSQACLFFLSDIYAPRDFSQRDHDGTRIYNFMHKFLPEAALYPLAAALQVNRMTQQLDVQLAEMMQDQLGVVDRFDMARYEEAYRLCDNYEERSHQIAMVKEIGTHLDPLLRVPFIGSTLRMARRPATRLGWIEMQSFLERGYQAWRSLKRPEVFLNTIEQREQAILDRIYGMPGGAPESNPFLVTDGGPPEIVLATVPVAGNQPGTGGAGGDTDSGAYPRGAEGAEGKQGRRSRRGQGRQT
jgi:hypothetical protein